MAPRKTSTTRERRSYALPMETIRQLQALIAHTRPTETAVIIEAIDRLAKDNGITPAE